MLTGIFSPSKCAECKLCCNFHRSSAWETPALEPELIFHLHELCIPLIKREDGTTSFYLDFKTDSSDEVANCPMLDPNSGCMLPREMRPLECRIWPVRLMKKSGTNVIGIYRNCAALNKQAFEELKSAVLNELLPIILEYSRRCPQAIREYDPAYEIIWTEEKL